MRTLAGAFEARGLTALVWTYGYAHALLTRVQNPGRAEALAALVRPGDIVLGHSNGAALAWMAAAQGAPMQGAILINPALDTDKVMAEQVQWVNLYPNGHDVAVKVAKLFCKHPWGAQGRHGLLVEDSRYLTRFTDLEGPTGEPAVYGHGAVLAPRPLAAWKDRIVTDALARLR